MMTGIVLNDGQEWKVMRRTGLNGLRDFGMGTKSLEQRIQEESRALVQVFDEMEERPFDPHMMLHNAFSNIICSMIFGERYNNASNPYMYTPCMTSSTARYVA